MTEEENTKSLTREELIELLLEFFERW